MTVRTRFAPSPTGYLHIGGVRTALFNWLFARHAGGSFILRVEDTDKERSTDESTAAILDGMAWLGLTVDEGPFFQSERYDLYREEVTKLVTSGHAYKCWCTADELKARRDKAQVEGRSPKYDGRCRALEKEPDGPYAVRFKVEPGKTNFKDLIKGAISFDHSEIEDLVILRSDNTPTYNLCVVVDDALMKLTHVIRGDDHINNTPKQILLYNALGYAVPEFAHLPMILGSDKTRLSKRHGASSVLAYKEMGYLPEALINYLARLGWSHGDQEIFSLDELIEKFTLDNVGTSAGVFNPDKLKWLNQQYIKNTPAPELAEPLIEQLKMLEIDAQPGRRIEEIIETLKERAETIKDMAEGARFFFVDDFTYDEKAANKFLTEEKLQILTLLTERLGKISDLNAEVVESIFVNIMGELDLERSPSR
jgi:glutamyl-tRNA synthetase